MSKIRVLPDVLANKIAAGEVVERPASVVKELLENALDASSGSIEIGIEHGGRGLIRVRDDGEGMTKDDAILAFERHATSKIRQVEDLDSIATLGFRGEALPSIAAVAKVELRTRAREEETGTHVTIVGGRMVDVKEIAWPGGTEIAAADLFFNVPARRKFLRSESTELFHISNLVTHYALANPRTTLRLSQAGRLLIDASPVEALSARAYQLLGAGFLEASVEIDSAFEDLRLTGFVSKPSHARSTRDSQFYFVNRRFVRDRMFSKAVLTAYRNVIPSGMFPSVILFLEMPVTEVDVNAHPAKIEVRFRRPNVVHDFVAEAISRAISEQKPFARFSSEVSRSSGPASWRPGSAPLQAFQLEAPRPRFVPPAQQALNLFAPSRDVRPPNESDEISPAASQPAQSDLLPDLDTAIAAFETSGGGRCHPAEFGVSDVQADSLSSRISPLGQLRESYIVAVDAQGLLLIDQHVAHERVLFEKRLNERQNESVERQRLLIPETIDLTASQLALFEMLRPELEANGFEVTELSGRTVAVQSVPAGIPGGDARSLLMELIETVEADSRSLSLQQIRQEVAASVACHAAIKINTPLTMEKMTWLIDELLKTKIPTNCPHGRPIILKFTLHDIERGFQRI